MMNLHRLLGVTLVAGLVGACTSLTTVNGGCGSHPNSSVCLGKMRVPKKKADYFVQASTKAVDVISSPAFRRDLEAFIARHAQAGEHSGDWSGLTADKLIVGLLSGINGVEITTMNDVVGIYRKLIFHTAAMEGNPIRFNPKNIGTVATIANSIAHEATHNSPINGKHHHYHIGSSAAEKEIGLCEPPYVIGSLVEKHADPTAWDASEHCSLLADL